jgi:hypothetical protein
MLNAAQNQGKATLIAHQRFADANAATSLFGNAALNSI